MQRQHQLRRRDGLALDGVDDGQHRLHRFDAGRDGLFGPAGLLDRHGAEGVALGDVVGLLEARDLEPFAAEPDHDHAAHVGIGRIAPGGPLQRVEDHAAIVDDAAIGLLQRHDAVDVGVLLENPRALDLAGDEAGDSGGTVHRGEDAHIVARPHLAIGAAVALERRLLRAGDEVGRHHAFAKGIVARERPMLVADAAIVLVHPVARGNVGFGKADDLPEFQHRGARRDGARCEFMAARHPRRRRDALRRHLPLLELADRHRDVVARVEDERAGGLDRGGFVHLQHAFEMGRGDTAAGWGRFDAKTRVRLARRPPIARAAAG